MKTKCAWCGKILKDDGSTDAAVPVSHGMCHPLCDEAKAMGWSDDVTVKVPDTNKPLIASIVAGLIFGCLTASANPAQPLSSVGQPVISQSFLSRVEQIESGGNAHAIGGGGKARGSFQFHAAAWQMVNNSRAMGHRPQARYESHAHDRRVAREFAFEYFTILHRQFVKAGRTPTHADLYAAWNLGFAGYKNRGFDLRRCPEITRRACAKF